jgi:hypothetical protein
MNDGNKNPGIEVRFQGLGWTALRAFLSLLAGLAVAVMLSYLLYRVGLPSKPFIYVSF